MAVTTVQSNNKLVVFRKEVYREYIRQSLFAPYIGQEMTAIIRVINDLKKGGEQLNIPLIKRLKNAAIATGPMVGNEESIDNYGDRMWIDWARNAVVIQRSEEQRSSIDLFAQARPLIEDWGKELQRDEIVDTFYAIPLDSTAPAGLSSNNGQRVNGALFDASTATQKQNWLNDNSDRNLLGGSNANFASSASWATNMANITSAMTLSAASLVKMKRICRVNANPRIRPYKLKNGREYFVTFVGSRCFRDLQNDATIIAANTQARPREGDGLDKNPLFQDGDLIYQGLIIREIPELDIRLPVTYTTAGASSVQIAPAFMCGQGSVAWAWGRMPLPTFRKEDDYQFLRGVGVMMAYGMKKIATKTPTIVTNGTATGAYREWGIFTGYFASASDT